MQGSLVSYLYMCKSSSSHRPLSGCGFMKDVVSDFMKLYLHVLNDQ